MQKIVIIDSEHTILCDAVQRKLKEEFGEYEIEYVDTMSPDLDLANRDSQRFAFKPTFAQIITPEEPKEMKLVEELLRTADLFKQFQMFDSSMTRKQLADSHKVEKVRTEPKLGRNDPCSCHSGKKFKQCCLKS